jgi:chromosomal replication initiation ATPase DnaA
MSRSGEKPPARQLAFDLPLDPRFGREDFLVSPSNEHAYALIEGWPDWPDPVLCLSGPRGSGKSHLASIWATAAHAWTVDAFEIDPGRVAHLVSAGALVIEDCDRGGPDEAALFHLLNLAREKGSFVLLTGEGEPDRWGFSTPDLVSRLRLAPGVALAPPDDALLRAVLVKLFMDRQLVVDLSVVEMIAMRLPRSLAKAVEIVALLDREGLSRGRRITRPLAASVLSAVDTEDED